MKTKKQIYRQCCVFITLFAAIMLACNSIVLIKSYYVFKDNNVYDVNHVVELYNYDTTKVDLSIITATRNDNYRNSTLRLRNFLHQFVYFKWDSIYNLRIEIIITEWNSVNSSLHMHEFPEIRTLLHSKFKECNVRFVIVPPFFHNKINKKGFQCYFHEYYAKNVAMRHAKGKWILASNTDNIFPVQLLQWLAIHLKNKTLNDNGLYHVTRKAYQGDKLPAFFNTYTDPTQSPPLIPVVSDEIDYCYWNQDLKPNYDINQCTSYELAKKRMVVSVGDFTLLRSYHIYNNFGGGYLQIPQASGMDSEFVERQIFINKLVAYMISDLCGYICHLQHPSTIDHKKLPWFKAWRKYKKRNYREDYNTIWNTRNQIAWHPGVFIPHLKEYMINHSLMLVNSTQSALFANISSEFIPWNLNHYIESNAKWGLKGQKLQTFEF